MPRFLFTCAYDGTPWRGWQSQTGGGTVQDCMEEAMGRILKQPCRVHAAGRTDAGVHALGQRFHIDVPEENHMDAASWIAALNANLPTSIRVLHAQPVADDFHARFSALGKLYEYRICQAAVLPPHWAGRAWHRRECCDEALLQQALHCYLGQHDFRRFAARRGNEPDPLPADYFVRTIDRSDVEHEGEDMLLLRFHGTGFLYRMVRFLVGYAWSVATGRIPLRQITEAFEHPDIESPGRYCAPPDGLFLVSVDYPDGQ